MAEKRKDSKGRVLPPNVTERKDGVYVWRKTIDGKAYSVSSKNLGELKRKIIDIEHDIKNGTVKEKNSLSDITMDEWFEKWRNNYKVGFAKETTVLKYSSNYRIHISPVFGKRKVKDIRNVDVREFAKTLSGKNLTNTTVDCILFVLHDMFARAEENEIIPKIPFKKITTRRDTYDGERKDGKPRRALTKQEQKTFLDFLKTDTEYKIFRNLFVVMFGTGLRVGEVTGLRECDIDFERNILTVNHQIIYANFQDGKGCRAKVTDPKTKKSRREIPMLSSVKEALQDQLKYVKENITEPAELDGYTGFIFYNPLNRLVSKKYVQTIIRTIVNAYNKSEQEAVLQGKETPFFLTSFTPHEIRHTFATRCMESGMKPKVLQELMGHGTLGITMNLYAHVLADTKEDEIKLLENMDL